ncbi:MAG: carboxy terminal-processing peptidase [Polyangiaceae bacterium]
MRSRHHWPLLFLALAACSSKPSASTSSAPIVTGTSQQVAKPELPQTLQDPREPMLARTIDELLSEQHLLRKPIDDALSKEAFPKYLEELDGSKLFLLKENITSLSQFSDQMDDELEQGDLLLARYGAALMARRRKVVADMVASLLASPFDFTEKESFEADSEKREYCASEDDLKARWRAFLKLQVLERVEQLDQIADALQKQKDKAAEAKSSDPKKKVADKPKDKDAGKDKPKDKDKAKDKDVAQKDEPPPPKFEDIPPTFEGREEKARKELATRYATRFTRWADPEGLEPAEQFLNAVASVYDPHTVFMAPSESENFDIQITGTLEGIGAALGEEDHYVAVKEIIPGGASAQQGKLETGDLILAVAQEKGDPVDVTDMPIDKVVGMIRGPKGTIVTLTVKKADGHIESISIKRDVVQIEANYARGAIISLGKGRESVGYIKLPGFYGELKSRSKQAERNATDDVKALLDGLKQRGVKAVILDLRGNGGGLLDHARDISGLFSPTGPVVAARDSDGKMDVLVDKNPEVTFDGDLVVMVDRFSASASEIVAAALQDYQRAVIVGTGPTHGKGTVQAVVELDRYRKTPPKPGQSLGIFKITIEQFFRVNGESTQWRGVIPDVVLPDPASWVESGERTLFHSIPWTSIDPLHYDIVPHKWSPQALSASSKQRVSGDSAFAKIDEFGQVLTKQRKDTLVPVELQAWKEMRKRERDALDAADPQLSKLKPRFDVIPVDAKGAIQNVAPDDKASKQIEDFRNGLSKDIWIEESLRVLEDMAKAK